MERGQLDLVLHIDDGLLPVHFQSERLYQEDWICAVARDNFGDRLPLKEYLAASHIVVAMKWSIYPGKYRELQEWSRNSSEGKLLREIYGVDKNVAQ